MSVDSLWGKNTDRTSDVMPEQVMGFWRSLWQGFQHLLTASGANIVGPVLMHLDPSMALFTSGVGTLIYNRFVGVPAYLGTSFSYIPPIAAMMTAGAGQGVVAGGIIAAGLATVLVGLLVQLVGWRWINIVMPPVVLAMVVITIGLLLAPVAWSEATQAPLLAVITFGLGVIFAARFKPGSLFSMLPVLLSIVVGYIVALLLGKVDLGPVSAAPFFTLPRLIMPVFDFNFMGEMALIAVTAVLMEHLGHLQGTGSIVGRDYIPRAGKSLVVDGIANALSWSGTPSTTYGENMGVYALTRVFSIRVMYLAGLLAVLAGFMGKLSPLILSIPAGVLGGATFLLFGMIAWAGFNLLATEHVNFGEKANQIIIASMGSMMVAGILVEWLRQQSIPKDATGILAFAHTLNFGSFAMPGVVAVALVGIVLNLILNWGQIVSEARSPLRASAEETPVRA